MTQPTQDPKSIGHEHIAGGTPCHLCGKKTKVGNPTPATKPLDELIDETDIGIILSDYMGSRWNGNMRDDIVDMVNLKYKARIATLQAKEEK